MPEVLYGRSLGEYTVDELKTLLVKEEERLASLKTALQGKKLTKSGSKARLERKGTMAREFTEKEKKAVKAVFDEIDADGSGDLNLDELAKVVDRLGCEWDESELLAAHRELDADGDGRITADEFLKWWAADINRGSYRNSALAKLRGRLGAREHTTTGLSGLKVAFDSSKTPKKSKIDFSCDVGDYSASNATSVTLKKVDSSRDALFSKVDELMKHTGGLDAWFNPNPEDNHDLAIAYRHSQKHYAMLNQARFKINKGKAQNVTDAVTLGMKEYYKIFKETMSDALECSDDGTKDLLAKFGIKETNGEVTPESAKAYRKECLKLGPNICITDDGSDLDDDEIEGHELDEETDEGRLLTHLIKDQTLAALHHVVNIDVQEEELVISMVTYACPRQRENMIKEVTTFISEEYFNKVLGVFSMTLGIGGNYTQHLRNVYEKDARILDVLGWGFSAGLEVEYMPAILEAIISSAGSIQHSIMIPSFLSSLMNSCKLRTKLRNPYSRIGEIIDYMIADARCTFVRYAGLNEDGEGYVWNKEAEDQLEDLGKWAHFFLKTVQEMARTSNPLIAKLILKAAAKVKKLMMNSVVDEERIDGWKVYQGVREAIAEFKGVETWTEWLGAELGVVGELSPFVNFPSDAVLEKLKTSTGISVSDDHMKECARRRELLDDNSDFVESNFSQLKQATEAIEDIVGREKMIYKDGLVFTTLVLRTIKERNLGFGRSPIYDGEVLFNMLLGDFSNDGGSGDDSD